jgi:NAD(P)-dependent dehydrogenase (short-subunit alcohol dehydrogenase family)
MKKALMVKTLGNCKRNPLMSRLKGKVALITGAASGIGEATAELLAKEGAAVVVVDINGGLGEEVVNKINHAGGKADFFHANVMRELDCKSMIEFADSTHGRLDILFNNAGIMHSSDGDVLDLEDKALNMTLSINLKGVIWGCKYGFPAIKRGGGGSVINTSSITSLLGSAASRIAYTASKGAILSLSRDLAVVHAGSGIRVNTISPGPVESKGFSKYIEANPEGLECRLKQIPMRRLATPNDVAKLVLFLASDDSSYITGSNFVIDGGITAAYFTSQELS